MASIRKKVRLLIATVLIGFTAASFATTITINDGASLIISGGEVTLNCTDVEVIVNSGGTLSISDGTVKDLNLSIKAGGSYNRSGGSVTECDGFYIITTPNGTAIINL